jgi:hypothetical protein
MKRTLLAVGVAVLASMLFTPHEDGWHVSPFGYNYPYGLNWWHWFPIFWIEGGNSILLVNFIGQTAFVALLAAVLVNLRKWSDSYRQWFCWPCHRRWFGPRANLIAGTSMIPRSTHAKWGTTTPMMPMNCGNAFKMRATNTNPASKSATANLPLYFALIGLSPLLVYFEIAGNRPMIGDGWLNYRRISNLIDVLAEQIIERGVWIPSLSGVRNTSGQRAPLMDIRKTCFLDHV